MKNLLPTWWPHHAISDNLVYSPGTWVIPQADRPRLKNRTHYIGPLHSLTLPRKVQRQAGIDVSAGFCHELSIDFQGTWPAFHDRI